MTDQPEVADLTHIQFYDSAARADGGPVWPADPPPTHVMLYADRTPPQNADQAPPGAQVHWITNTGEKWRAVAADYEPGNLIYDDPPRIRRWAELRVTELGRAVIYCQRSLLHGLHDRLGPVLFTDARLKFWIPTLDNRQWTAAELSWDIAHSWSVYIPAARLWANQYAGEGSGSGGPWDISNLYGSWDLP